MPFKRTENNYLLNCRCPLCMSMWSCGYTLPNAHTCSCIRTQHFSSLRA